MQNPIARPIVGATGALILIGGGALAIAPPAYAAEYFVSTEAELIEAIDASNGSPGIDTILIAEGEITLTDDLPEIADDIVIRGAGSDSTTISGAGSWDTLSLAGSAATADTAVIEALTVTDSLTAAIESLWVDLTLTDVDIRASGTSALTYVGAALHVTDSSFDGSAAGDGATILSDPGGTVTFTASQLTGNSGNGLRIGSSLPGIGTNLTIAATDVVASGNGANGIYVGTNGVGENYHVTFDQVVTDSNAEVGIDLYTDTGSVVEIAHATATANQGGGLQLGGRGSSLTVTDSTVSGNGTDALVAGGGIQFSNTIDSALTIENTTVSGNRAHDAAGMYTALVGDASATILNSTISANTAVDAAGGIGADTSEGLLSLTNTTIVDNVSGSGVGGVELFEAHAVVTDSIIAANTGGDLAIDGDVGLSTLGVSHSLVQTPDASAASSVTGGTGNLTDIDAQLESLADNGGPTLTHLPQQTSPVIDAGNPAVTGVPPTDQRGAGFERIVRIIDMGAVEVQHPPAIPEVPLQPAEPADSAVAALPATGFDSGAAGISITAAVLGLLLMSGAAILRRSKA